jgi:hypothetical protein
MARIHIAQRMETAIEKIQRACWGPFSLDIVRECKDQWSRNYAIVAVHIGEPGCDCCQDVSSIHHHILERVAETFGPRAVAVRKRGAAPRDKNRLIVQLHPLHSFDVEVEVYRSTPTSAAS